MIYVIIELTGQSEFTHVSLGGSALPGKFNFDKTGYSTLCKLLNKALKLNLIFSVAESPKDYGPVK